MKCQGFDREEKCPKAATFGYELDGKKVMCSKHSLTGMSNLSYNRCRNPECKKYACYGFKKLGKNSPTKLGNSSPTKLGAKMYCAEHKKEGMVNLSANSCRFEGCKTVASFNYPTIRKKIYCNKHKLEGMISNNAKKCQGLTEAGKKCPNRAYFNFPGKLEPIFCLKHKENDMIKSYSKFCQESSCTRIAKYEGYCQYHFNSKCNTVLSSDIVI